MSRPIPSAAAIPSKVERQNHPNLLPVVRRVIEQLNQLFIDHFGLLGKGLVDDIFKHWLHAGKTGPSGLRHYVYALGVQLEDPGVRKDFTERAERLLLHLQSGYVS
ncbi:hypothetical protein [Cellvibrio sp.]|jgi:hypothetical protein